MFTRLSYLSTKGRLLIFGLSVALMPISLITTIYYLNARNTLKKRIFEDLRAISASKELHVLSSLEATKVQTACFATDGFIRSSLETLVQGGTKQETSTGLSRYLLKDKLPLCRHLMAMAVADKYGKIVSSTNEKLIGKDISRQDVFVQGKSRNYGEMYTGKSYCSPCFNTCCISVSAPIVSRQGAEPVGVIVNAYSLEILDDVTTNRVGLGETGEVYLVSKDKIMFTESRFINNAPLEQVVDTEPVRKIFRDGDEMVGIYPNYRGVPVVGASEYISEYGWVLLTETGKAEAFAPLKILGIVALILGVVSAAAAAGVGIVFAASMSKPIGDLMDAAGRLAGGDLACRLTVTRRDDIGNLARSFNTMADSLAKEIGESKRANNEIVERMRLAEFVARVSVVLTQQGPLRGALQGCAEAIVKHIDAAFARIWTLNSEQDVLELQASAGMYTHIDGPHSRVPVGALKIGLIALERKPHLTNAVIGDPRVDNQEWAKREGMVAFAGYPLIVEDNLIGVMAMFSRKKVEESVLKSLGAVADIIALGIQQKQTEHKMMVLSESLEVRVTERTELLARTNEALQSEIADRKKIEVEIRQAKSELEWRKRMSRLLIQMGDNLHVCNKAEEAYAAIDQSARQLFPDDSGALFIFNASRNLLEVVFAFGEAIPGEKYYAPDDCWALRKGQLHMVLGNRPVMHCKYFETVTGNYICAPIISQSEIVGVFHLILGQNSIAKSDEYWLAAKKTLTERMVERIVSALSNLKLREKLRDLSIHDPLTGLFNRRYMNELLERELCRAERKKLPLCVIMIDIDHFKQFNDTFGHDAGDAVLHDLGLFLQEYIRGSDIAYRYGGEEFVIILPDASGEVARNRADQLRKAIKQMRVHDKGQCLGVITISLGVAVFPENGVTAESLLKAADGALYRAKQAGRDRVCVAWEE